jgi:aspartate/methionine/tyrosine aminotransferase
MPAFVIESITEAAALYGKYPPIRGLEELRAAIAGWCGRRYGLQGAAAIDPETEVLPCNGSREGLFYACLPAAGRKPSKGRSSSRPAVLMCNPYYQAYLGAALAVQAEPVFLNATAATGHLPDLERLAADAALLDRTIAFYLCSPANPQGVVADRAYIARALELARAHDFILFLDECYSELYATAPPTGGLEVAATKADRFRNPSCSTRSPSARACPVCARAFAPAMQGSCKHSVRSAT